MTLMYEEISFKCALETYHKDIILTTDCCHRFIETHWTEEINIDNCRAPVAVIAVNNGVLLGGNHKKGEFANQATRLPKLHGGDTCE